ncbi:acyloxyacyl hydrolase [Persicobacter diffluens]|uniref:Acyloxyacyl hydrolase n=1 Tax=Persicobacter diffluens TaxID=981 RepID=A0AAN4W412_9BACT|nr:hypothetical protein PEDI_41720 [Persicobacter diffluens]
MKNYIWNKLLLLFIPTCLMISPSALSQSRPYQFLRLKSQAGTVMETNSFLKGENSLELPIDYYHSYSLEFGRQTIGDNEWEQNYLFPKYGLGFYSAAFFFQKGEENPNDISAKELGNPLAIYGFFEGPFKRWRKLSWHYRMAFGLTYNWNPYDPEDNPFQIAIGSKKTVYIEGGTYLEYPIAKRWDLMAGFSVTHFSNGATTTPNYGINMLAPYLTVQYNFINEQRNQFEFKDPTPFESENEINIGYAMGMKQITNPSNSELERFPDLGFLVTNINTNFMRRISPKSKIGLGLDLNYDGSNHANIIAGEDGLPIKEDNGLKYKISFGSYAGYELVIDRLSLVMNVGAYFLREHYEDIKPVMYQRLGLKYHVYNDLFAGIYVRAYDFAVADFVEWQIGYRIFKN